MSKKQQPIPTRRHQDGASRQARATPSDLEARYSFRRNRTLTGSLSSDVVSVNEHRSELKSARVHTHHLRRRRRHAGLLLAGVLTISAVVGFLVYQSIMSVVVVSAVPVANETIYEQKIQEYLVKHPLERFRFAFKSNAVAAYLQSHGMPEVDSVDEQPLMDGFGRAAVKLQFRQPAVAWQTAGKKLYVDTRGNSFQQNYYTEPTVQVVDQTGITSVNNQVLASNRFLGFIGKVVGRMAESQYKVTQIVLPANTTRQVLVRLDGVNYPIKFNVDRPVGEQAEDAARAIRYLQSKGINPEYVDIRVSGKAYYR